MSKYEDYNTVSNSYDKIRYAMGVDVICGMISFYTKKPLADLHILDAGCGTGNYSRDMIGYGVRHLSMLDASEGMLGKAKAKMAKYIKDGRVKEIILAMMPPLPFPAANFDVVMFNMVLHHVEKNPDGEHYPTIEIALKDVRRVLKQGGVLSISSLYPEEVLPVTWYARLNENIGQTHTKRYPGPRQWEAMLNRAGFRTLSIMQVKCDTPQILLSHARDPEGPMKKEWRATNSYWANASAEEINDVESKIKQMKEAGTLEKFVEDNDKSEGYDIVLFVFAEAVSMCLK